MKKSINYRQLTLKQTGMSVQQYNKEYKQYAARVRNFNLATGSNISAAQYFRQHKTNPYFTQYNPMAKAIEQTPTTRPTVATAKLKSPDAYLSTKIRKAAEVGTVGTFDIKTGEVSGGVWSGAINNSDYIRGLYEKIGTTDPKTGQVYTLADFNRDADAWSKNLRARRKANPFAPSND